MAQLCLNGRWSDGLLTWTRGEAYEGETPEGDRMLAFYEEGNLYAQGGDLEKALALFQRGLSAFLAIDNPSEGQRMAEAALLWGLGTASDRVDRGETGWRTLLKVLSPGQERKQLPLGLALNWTHSAVMAGYRHDHYLEVVALLDALQRLASSQELDGADPAALEAVKERYAMLEPYRSRCFEGLMQEERYAEAAQVAQQALETQRSCDPEDQRALALWESLQQAAAEGRPGFRLQADEESFEEEADEPSEMGELALRVRWDGQGPLAWKRGQPPEDPNLSALARLYAEAAQTAAQGDHGKALALYERGLAAWEALKHPRSSDAAVRSMMLLGKASLQDRLGTFDSSDAWSTLLKLAEPKQGAALPLPLLLEWVQACAIVGAGLRKLDEVGHLLVFLMQMSLHPKLGGAHEGLREELTQRFLFLLEGTYGGLEGKPQTAADWLRGLQKRLEPEAMILVPLREILYHALSEAERHREAEAVATEVMIWARQGNDPETALQWELKVRAAQSSMSG